MITIPIWLLVALVICSLVPASILVLIIVTIWQLATGQIGLGLR